jgi:FtsH-binding integral membrane protein
MSSQEKRPLAWTVRAAISLLGLFFVAVGITLSSTPARISACGLDDMRGWPAAVFSTGLVVFGALLLLPKAGAAGLGLLAAWVTAWGWWAPLPAPWLRRPCWQVPALMGLLFAIMGLMGLANQTQRQRPDTRTVLFMGVAYLVAAVAFLIFR